MYDENRTSILNNYRPAEDEELNKTHIVKEFSGKTDRSNKLVVYTDGSVHGADATYDGRSFGGYGFACKSTGSTGYINEFSRYGQLDNVSPKEAELFSLLAALKYNNEPSHIEIVSDSSYVVNGLKNIWEQVSKHYEMSKIPANERTKEDRAEFRNLRMWKSINDYLYQETNITSLSVRWVRSHTISDEEAKNVHPSDFKNSIERRYVEDILGNNQADKISTLGVIKSIQNSLNYLNKLDPTRKESLISKNIFMKNINSSLFAKDEVVRFVSTKPVGYFDEDLLREILPEIVLNRIDEARKKIEGGLSHSDAISNLIMHPKVRAFEQIKEDQNKPFLRKVIQRTKEEESESGLSI